MNNSKHDSKPALELASLIFALVVIVASPKPSFAQGPLAPSGAPAPTMKTLDQIEPRTPISSLPFNIATSGSYFLTKNLSVTGGNAIAITADNVTLDLNGFTVSSTASPANGTGIYVTGSFFAHQNIQIRNGSVRGSVAFGGGSYTGPGFLDGIATGQGVVSARVSNVTVSGCAGVGIYLGVGDTSTVIESCTVDTVGTYGMAAASVSNSIATTCGSAAIRAEVAENSRGDCTGNDIGLTATSAFHCSGTSGSNIGLSAMVAADCLGQTLSTQPSLKANAANNCYAENFGNGHAVQGDVANNDWGHTYGNGTAISANVAANSYGDSEGDGFAVYVQSSTLNCYGDGHVSGLYAGTTACNCFGKSRIVVGGNGLFTVAAENSWGDTYGGTYGLQSTVAINSYGKTSGTNGTIGLNAASALNCQGIGDASDNHAAALAATVAIGCTGQSAGGGAGVYATIANTCLNAAASIFKYNCF